MGRVKQVGGPLIGTGAVESDKTWHCSQLSPNNSPFDDGVRAVAGSTRLERCDRWAGLVMALYQLQPRLISIKNVLCVSRKMVVLMPVWPHRPGTRYSWQTRV